jgi:hypothetical protein
MRTFLKLNLKQLIQSLLSLSGIEIQGVTICDYVEHVQLLFHNLTALQERNNKLIVHTRIDVYTFLQPVLYRLNVSRYSVI